MGEDTGFGDGGTYVAILEGMRADLAYTKKKLQEALEQIGPFRPSDPIDPLKYERNRQNAAVGRAVMCAYRPSEFRTPMVTW